MSMTLSGPDLPLDQVFLSRDTPSHWRAVAIEGRAVTHVVRNPASGVRLANFAGATHEQLDDVAVGLAELPFGGAKDSGYGSEGGVEAVEAYLVTELVTHTFN